MDKHYNIKNYNGIDVAKLVFGIMVVAIHTMGKYGLYPFLRIAVPMFFCISSFLFFEKCDGKNDSQRLKRFLFRNAKLYTFWFTVLLLPTLFIGGWLKGNLLVNAIRFIVKIFVGSTFAASWYIPALMICIGIIYWCCKKVPDWVMLFISFLVYVLCCIASNYCGFLPEASILFRAIIIYPGTIYNSFPVGLLWVTLGKCMANGGGRNLLKKNNVYRRGNIVALAVWRVCSH